MVEIQDVVILNMDKSGSIWAIEGEIMFDSNLAVSFSVDYDHNDDELVDIQLEIDPGKYDKTLLKEMILQSAQEYED